jgi:hypothetical protein
LREAGEWARLPSAEGLLSGRGPKRSLQSVLCCTLQTCFGWNRDPKGARNAKQKTECRWALESSEAVSEHKARYKTADTFQSKVLICHEGCGSSTNGGAIRADISSARTAGSCHRRCGPKSIAMSRWESASFRTPTLTTYCRRFATLRHACRKLTLF